MEADIIELKRKLTNAYRNAKGLQTKAEKKHLETPISEFLYEALKYQGYALGLKRCLDFVEGRLESLELPLDDLGPSLPRREAV